MLLPCNNIDIHAIVKDIINNLKGFITHVVPYGIWHLVHVIAWEVCFEVTDTPVAITPKVQTHLIRVLTPCLVLCERISIEIFAHVKNI